jgi:hypothetical protein
VEVLEGEGMNADSEVLLAKVEACCAHYLVENKTALHHTHVLSSALTLMPLTVLPAKQNKKTTISFHPPLPNKIQDKPFLI